MLFFILREAKIWLKHKDNLHSCTPNDQDMSKEVLQRFVIEISHWMTLQIVKLVEIDSDQIKTLL